MPAKHEGFHPEPLGKITPSLAGSYSYNHDYTPDWILFLCPSCNSDNICCLHPDLSDYGFRWFCISCQSSWIWVPDTDED